MKKVKCIIFRIVCKLSELRIIPLSDKKYIELKYYSKFARKIDLKNPKTFNEKLQWLKLYDRKDLYSLLVDKYEVKKYVSNIIGSNYIIPTIGIYNDFKEIDFNSLPNQFVMKCTHNSGAILICKDKNTFDINKAKKVIKKCLKRNYYYSGREWPYKNVKPRIIIEKYMEDKQGVLNDFKLQTFNGKVAFSFVCTDRMKGKVKYTFFDKDKKFIPITQCGVPYDLKNAKLPDKYEKFVDLAEKLSKGIPEVRMDFYDVDGKIFFGEYTFFDSSGFGKYDPDEFDYQLGKMLDLSNIK